MNSSPIDAQPARRRRRIMPLIIVVVAVALIFWKGGPQPGAAHQAEVLQHVTQLCRRASEGADLRGRVNPDDPFTEAKLIEQLQRVSPGSSPNPDSRSQISNLKFTLIARDALPPGSIPQRATHHVMISKSGVDQLGLHIEHPGDSHQIRVLGYWLP